MAEQMSDDEFQGKLKTLGLDVDNTPASQPDVSPVADPNQADAPAGQANPGVGFEGDPAQEKSPIVAGPVPPAAQNGPNASFQPKAQVASSDASDTGEDDDGSPAEQKKDAEAKEEISGLIKNPVVNAYIRKKYGANPDLNQVAMTEAQEQANQKRLLAGIGSGLETIARAPTAIKPDDAFYENMSKNADSGVKDIQAKQKARTDKISNDLNTQKLQQELDDNDPDSPMAQKLRDTYTKAFKALGVDSSMMDGASPRQMNTYYSKILESANVAEMRKQAAALAAQNRQDKMDRAESDKNAQMQDKISKEVNNLNASSRNALGASGRVLTSADRALAVLNQKTITPQDLNAVASDVSTLINGQATISGAHGQEYKNAATTLADLSQKITSGAVNVNAPEVKAHLREVISSMRQVSSGVANANLNIVKVTHPEFAKKNPSYFDDVAKAYAEQAQPGSMINNGTTTPAAGSPTPPPAPTPTKPAAPTPTKPAAPQAPAATSNMIGITASDGSKHMIPKTPEAIAGAKKIDAGLKVDGQ